MHILKWEDR